MSSVIEPLLEGAEVSHYRGIADNELLMLISRFRTPFNTSVQTLETREKPCPLSYAARHGTGPALAGGPVPHPIPAPQVACPCVDLTATRQSSFLNHASPDVLPQLFSVTLPCRTVGCPDIMDESR
jgi:hypothetical protein